MTASLLSPYLFMWANEHDRAEERFIEKYRQKFLTDESKKGGE